MDFEREEEQRSTMTVPHAIENDDASIENNTTINTEASSQTLTIEAGTVIDLDSSIRSDMRQLVDENTSIVTPERDGRNSDDEEKTRSLHQAAKVKGLDLDLDQPWQISLLHALEKLDIEEAKEARGRNETLMLRHAGSRDYALAVDSDDWTLGTCASSTIPMKPQRIHRTPAAILADRRAAAPSPNPVEDNRDEESTQDDADASSVQSNRSKPTPEALPGDRLIPRTSRRRRQTLERAKALNDTTNDEVDFGPLPQNGCFCLGYDVIDYLLPPVPVNQYQRKRIPRATGHLEDIIEDAMASMEETEGRVRSSGCIQEKLHRVIAKKRRVLKAPQMDPVGCHVADVFN